MDIFESPFLAVICICRWAAKYFRLCDIFQTIRKKESENYPKTEWIF
jgi:hypothetical protein